MSYPVIATPVVREHLDELLSGTRADLSEFVTRSGSGDEVDLSELHRAIESIEGALGNRLSSGDGGMDDDQFEGLMAGYLHRALSPLDIGVLDDPGFWAYLAAGPMWFFTQWREDPAKRKTETYHVYVDGTKADGCLPLRMYLRAQAIEADGDYSLASAVHGGTDFWRSHLIRVKSGGKKGLARAIVSIQRDNRMTVGPLREYAKRINRRWSNQVIHALDESECDQIAQSERSQL